MRWWRRLFRRAVRRRVAWATGPPPDMSARECPECRFRYPVHPLFRTCNRCKVATVTKRGDPDTSVEMGKRLQREWKAHYFFETWDRKREERGDITPEQAGRLDARRLLSLDRRAAA